MTVRPSQPPLAAHTRIVFVVVALCVGCTDDTRPATSPGASDTEESRGSDVSATSAVAARSRPPHSDFTGSAACRRCHAAICDEFHTHPMGRSLAAVHDAPAVEDDSPQPPIVTNSAKNSSITLSYAVERSGVDIVHRERAEHPEQGILFDHAVPVHFAIGSGRRGRSYIVNRDGLLFMSPISWYTQQQRWDLSPGYSERNLHFGRRVIDACVGCHAGRVDAIPNAASRYAPEPFREPAIGCERCHGPGRSHVLFHSGESTAASDLIVNPAKLTGRQRDHVCFQCHLIGEYRLLRVGRSDFDFQPGMELTDVWTIVLRQTSADNTAAVSQAEQMLDSVCYTSSNGELGCISCHDAHQLPSEAEAPDFYRQRCLNCHTSHNGTATCSEVLSRRNAAPVRDSCVACHMPSFEASDIPHTSQTDHRIPRRRPAAVSESFGDSALRIFGADDGTIPEAELDRARAFLTTIAAEAGTDIHLAQQAERDLKRWIAQYPEDLAALERLGVALEIQGKLEESRAVRERGLTLQPEHEELLTGLFALCEETHDFAAALDYGHRIAAVNPWEPEYQIRLSRIYETVGDTPAAIEHAERALQLNPAAFELHAWLADRYTAIGDADNAARHRDIARLVSERP